MIESPSIPKDMCVFRSPRKEEDEASREDSEDFSKDFISESGQVMEKEEEASRAKSKALVLRVQVKGNRKRGGGSIQREF